MSWWTEYIDQGRRSSLASLLDHPVADVGIVACVDFGYARCIGSGAKDMAHLVSFRDRVQVSGRCGVPGGLRGET